MASQLFFKTDFKPRPLHPPSPRERAEFIAKRLAEDLDLSDSQLTGIIAVLEQAEQEIHALQQEHFPKIDAIHDRSFQEIRKKLEAGQQIRLDEIQKELNRFRGRKKPASPDSPR